jgi:anti-repressor protein
MELIKITQSEGGKQVVSLRELYDFLQAKENFKDWANRMFSYDFAENVDYKANNVFIQAKNGFGGTTKMDFAITVNCAKEISMLQRTKKGKEARLYFLAREEQAKKLERLQIQIPQTFAEALQLAADQAKQLELQAPKVKFADSILESNTSISVSQMAKILGYGPNNFFSMLRDSDILMKFASRKNTPYQRFIDAGYFEVTERAWVKGEKEGITFVTRVTPKGQKYLTKKFGTN